MNKRAGLTKEQDERIDRLFEQIQRNKIDQETRRDQLAVLIAGGALTVSFAFVGGLTDHDPVNRVSWLIASWVAWALALVGALVGYTISIYGNNAMLEAMSAGEYDLEVITPTYGKYIEKVNIAVMVLVLVGFVAFGGFTLGNLDGSQEKGQEESVEEVGAAATPLQTGSVREQPADETSQLAPGKADENGGRGMNTGRNEEKGLTLPTAPPRYPSEPAPGTTQPSQPAPAPKTPPSTPSQGS